ncbi:MAG: DNA polymerase III subunit beta [Opitutales bacterium]|nr:DNA polymerase III subunit beta [Opitutales bacterium]
MKLKLNRDHLSNGLQQVMNLVGSRQTMPILKNVLIEAENDEVSLTTTNLDLGIRCTIKAEVLEPGSITLPVRKLASIVKELPNLEIHMETAVNNVSKITSGGSNFRIMGIGKEEFPPLPTFDDQHVFNLEQSGLAKMLKNVSYAESTDENRYVLNGVFFSFEGGALKLAATDGRRLAVSSEKIEAPEDSVGSLILPAKTVSELERLLNHGGALKILFNDRQVAFELEIGEEGDALGLKNNIYLVSKIVEGKYPDYQQVIPKEADQRVKLERELMLECVNRAALVISDKQFQVKLKISENLLEISGESQEFGESHETMAIAYEGPEVQVAFNPRFLMEPLKALANDEVFFEFKDELSPGVIKTMDDFLCVVMPLRIN